jgi:hypothetical protein
MTCRRAAGSGLFQLLTNFSMVVLISLMRAAWQSRPGASITRQLIETRLL